MNITVKYFASLRELLGRSEEALEIDESITVAEIWDQVSAGIEDPPVNHLTAVNMTYVKENAKVSEGDEVAFFPPVTGG
ncbi:MAG: molybdopterin converting factor subunit 1 [Gammaproteobacteria bacterium]